MITKTKVFSSKKKVAEIFKILAELNPKPRTELNYTNPYQLLIAVVLSAQATDIRVNLVSAQLFKIINTPQQMIDLGIDNLILYIKSIGLYQNKALYIMKLSQQLLTKYQSNVPDNFTDLISLAGVGRKTANVLLNTLYGQATIGVDTHVFRLANRIGIAIADTTLKVEQKLLQVIPKKYLINAHHWLILHGRYICQAKKPKCEICPIQKYCLYYFTSFKSSLQELVIL